MRDFLMPKSACPHCGYEMDHCTTPFSLDSPGAGDLSIYIKCAGFSQFDKKLQLQKLEEHDLNQIMLEDPKAYVQLMKGRDAVLSLKEEEGDRT